ncbi:uncharacterized protein LOC129718854 [Wyeomyia smithii]|uniref:uncharacterized protein LOC129718854 n=1 Tax=Wyeomyia smithii TaxID=174621 RepID=UPI002467B7DD|nr:uncharacterized protein LOC129718854 [Wyeomyia smithii]
MPTAKTPSSEAPVPPESTTQTKLAAFCELLRTIDRQIKHLVGAERAAVDKTLSKAVRFELLEKNNGIGLSGTLYPIDQIEHIQTECLHEINQRLIATGNAVTTLVDNYHQLIYAFRELERACSALDWNRGTELISGTAKQKPLEYYIQEGYRIVYQLNGLTISYKITFDAIEIRNSSSIQKFRDCLTVSEDLQLYLQEFLSYTIFVLK